MTAFQDTKTSKTAIRQPYCIQLHASLALSFVGVVIRPCDHGFVHVSVCHDFLGVLTTNDAHRRVVARAVHA